MKMGGKAILVSGRATNLVARARNIFILMFEMKIHPA